MENIPSKIRHDFINNALRIEVLNTLICEALDQKAKLPKEEVSDLINFLNMHLDYLKEIKEQLP